ncbi:hypothetical protein Adeg_0727 [Ammonifex degensii KC4]|uniref:PrgI family protein n=1 Tax=Ammonifex degensii (strain DSM 10501 / KC4) TaxID=429009 RepID=C9RC96_AMMDK|nr:PrgI family protein [Ammonifex degensii]ACX51873.1 hypothetical protein Adeg_0727 [Ammonifex degensii KC4]
MDLTEEEKLIGGVLSLRQVGYLVGGGMLSVLGVLFLRALGAPWALSVLALPPGAALGVLLAFYRFEGMNADEFLYRALAWRFRKKRFAWKGE